jgi:hypothetical protein
VVLEEVFLLQVLLHSMAEVEQVEERLQVEELAALVAVAMEQQVAVTAAAAVVQTLAAAEAAAASQVQVMAAAVTAVLD